MDLLQRMNKYPKTGESVQIHTRATLGWNGSSLFNPTKSVAYLEYMPSILLRKYGVTVIKYPFHYKFPFVVNSKNPIKEDRKKISSYKLSIVRGKCGTNT